MKKIFTRIIVASLCLSAFIGIIIFLFGSLNAFEGDVLFTTMLIGGFSITGLCCASLYDRRGLRTFSIGGIVLNIIGCIYFIMLTWDLISFDLWNEGELWIKTVLTTLLLAISSAHISLILLVDNNNVMVDRTKKISLLFAIILDLMFVITIWFNSITFEFFYRVLGTIAIITVLGTILLPILNRIYEGSSNKKYNKLVRDKIPDIIKAGGENPVTRVLSDREYKKALEMKLMEEYNEALNSKNSNERVEELADMLEVIFALGEIESKNQEQLLESMTNKRNKRGGFKNKIFLERVTK